jgi:hypothetical protein
MYKKVTENATTSSKSSPSPVFSGPNNAAYKPIPSSASADTQTKSYEGDAEQKQFEHDEGGLKDISAVTANEEDMLTV